MTAKTASRRTANARTEVGYRSTKRTRRAYSKASRRAGKAESAEG